MRPRTAHVRRRPVRVNGGDPAVATERQLHPTPTLRRLHQSFALCSRPIFGFSSQRSEASGLWSAQRSIPEHQKFVDHQMEVCALALRSSRPSPFNRHSPDSRQLRESRVALLTGLGNANRPPRKAILFLPELEVRIQFPPARSHQRTLCRTRCPPYGPTHRNVGLNGAASPCQSAIGLRRQLPGHPCDNDASLRVPSRWTTTVQARAR
jgi:hypothetical protein